MSSTRGAAAQRPLGAYYTPDPLARQLVGLLDLSRAEHVIEPSVGGGAFARAIQAAAPHAHLTTVDIDPSAPWGSPADGPRPLHPMIVGDWPAIAARWGPASRSPGRWVIGNPPFAAAEAHVRAALSVAPNVAMLLRLAFLESDARTPLWRDHPCADVWVLSHRPSFTGGGTDSCAYGWFVWRRHDHGMRLHVLTERP